MKYSRFAIAEEPVERVVLTARSEGRGGHFLIPKDREESEKTTTQRGPERPPRGAKKQGPQNPKDVTTGEITEVSDVVA